MHQNSTTWKIPPRYVAKILTPITASRMDVLIFNSDKSFLSSDQLTRDELFENICKGSKTELKK